MKGDTRCIEGRLYRHDPQPDDPNLEIDIGVCADCDGFGCDQAIEDAIDDEAARQILATSDEDALAGNWPPLVKCRSRSNEQK